MATKKLGGVSAKVNNRTPVHVTMSTAAAARLVGKLARAVSGGGRVRIWVAPSGRVHVDSLMRGAVR